MVIRMTKNEILIEANTILNSLDKIEQTLYDNSIKDKVLLEMLHNVRDIMEELKIEVINYENYVERYGVIKNDIRRSI